METGNENMKLSNKIVIFTKKFGEDFTGATLATQKLLLEWQEYFDDITVITKEIGKVSNNIKANIIICESYLSMWKQLDNYLDNDIVFYSDDHLGFLLGRKGKKYFHTYHGNWPDAKYNNFEYFIKSFFFIPLYRHTIAKAKSVINVSYYMDKYTRKFNENTLVIRNGLGHEKVKSEKEKMFSKNRKIEMNNRQLKIVMLGGIDKRKYTLAVELFNKLQTDYEDKVLVDIYGGIQNQNIARQLSSFKFVSLKGHVENIAISNYDILLNTSKIENLSISVCEAVSHHVPVICFNVGGLSEVVKNGLNGFVIEKKNTKAMADKIELIIDRGYEFVFFDHLNLEYDWKYSSELYLKQFMDRG